MLSSIAWITVMHHHTQPFSVEMGMGLGVEEVSHFFFAWVGLELQSS
jgi:hypothetical protein